MTTPTIGLSPLVPKGTAMALSFAPGLVPAGALAERIAQRYAWVLGTRQPQGDVGAVRATHSFPWIFPRPWYMQEVAARARAVPPWMQHAARLAGDETAAPGSLTETFDMPLVAATRAGAFGAADETVMAWASQFADGASPLDLALPARAHLARSPWQPISLAALGAGMPATIAHLAWSDATLARVARADAPSAGIFTEAPPLAVVRPQAAVRRASITASAPASASSSAFTTVAASASPSEGAPARSLLDAAGMTPRFAEDEEVSDDVFAAIARPVPRPTQEGRMAAIAAAPAVALNDQQDQRRFLSPAAYAHAKSTREQEVLWSMNGAPAGLAVRLSDGSPMRAAPQLFANGEALAAATSRSAPAPSMPLIAAYTHGSAYATRNANANHTLSPQGRRVASPGPTNFLPGARGFAAAAQAAAVAASVSALALEFVTPREAQAARAMQLAPTSWTTGVKLAAAGDGAVAAKWAQLEQLTLVSPSAAQPLMAGGTAALPRGAYQWPAAAMERWAEADVVGPDAREDATVTSSSLYQAFGAVWSEHMVRQKASRPARAAAQDDLATGGLAVLGVVAPHVAMNGNAPSAVQVPVATSMQVPPMPLGHVLAAPPAPAASGASAASAALARTLGGRLDAEALDYRVAIANRSQGVGANQRRAHRADEASMRVMAEVTAGLAKDDMPPAVAAWVAQFEAAVANDDQLIAVPPDVLADTAAGSPARRAAFTGPVVASAAGQRHANQEARADQAADVAALTSSYVVPKAAGGGQLRQELSRLHPREMAALLQASAQTSAGGGTVGSGPVHAFASGGFGGDSAGAAASLSESSLASVMAGVAPVLAGDATNADPSLYEMTMIAALGQAAPQALAARTTNELVPPEPSPGPSAVAPIDIEAEAQSVLREVLHQIAALRDRNGEF